MLRVEQYPSPESALFPLKPQDHTFPPKIIGFAAKNVYWLHVPPWGKPPLWGKWQLLYRLQPPLPIQALAGFPLHNERESKRLHAVKFWQGFELTSRIYLLLV